MATTRFAIFLVLYAGLTSPISSSAQSLGFSEQDWNALPPYCRVRMRGDENSKKVVAQEMGQEQFLHIHHFCFGLHFLNKSMLGLDSRKRQEFLEKSYSEFGYVIQHMPEAAPFREQAIRYQQQIKPMIKR